MTNEEILNNVESILAERQEQYGDIKANFHQIAEYWTVYLGMGVSAHDVAIMMALLKIARINPRAKNKDSYHDAIGYLVIGQRVDDEET